MRRKCPQTRMFPKEPKNLLGHNDRVGSGPLKSGEAFCEGAAQKMLDRCAGVLEDMIMQYDVSLHAVAPACGPIGSAAARGIGSSLRKNSLLAKL